MIKLIWKMKKEIRLMKKHDWSRLKEHGLADRKFLDDIIRKTALIKSLADMVGMEKASEIHLRIMDIMGYDLIASMFPSIEEFKACGDIFECLKEYTKAHKAANERAGTHNAEIGEDSDKVFEFNVKYCALQAIAAEFGNPYLCYPSNCYGDEVFFPKVCAEAGLKFRRTGTLATGAPVCDFRFERKNDPILAN